MKRVKAVMVKEFAHILRDPPSLTIIFLMPVLMMFIFGYSINYDLEKIETGIIDLSGGQLSRDLVRSFSNNRYFQVENLLDKYKGTGSDPFKEGERLLNDGKLKQVIIIPADFTEKLKNQQTTEVGIVIDGSDSNVANLVYQYNQQVLFDFLTDFQAIEELFRVRTKILFNPEMKSAYFFIPGLVAILLVMISAILTSVSITREKESGSIDLVFISPLKTAEIIIGKTVPYVAVAFLVGALTLLFARFWFGVPFRGSLPVLALFALLYIVAGLSMGILISTVAPSQKVAMFAALLSTLLPSIMLSGFIFPLDSMAAPLRMISHLVPARYFLNIIRGVAVKGAEFKHFVNDGIALVIFAAVLMTLAGVKFSKNRKRAK
jgi:ABC-2 type transport system permease protein